MIQLENAGLQRLCDAKDKLLEAREAEKQQLEEMLEQRLSDLGISPEQLCDNVTPEKQAAEKQTVVCKCILQLKSFSLLFSLLHWISSPVVSSWKSVA